MVSESSRNLKQSSDLSKLYKSAFTKHLEDMGGHTDQKSNVAASVERKPIDGAPTENKTAAAASPEKKEPAVAAVEPKSVTPPGTFCSLLTGNTVNLYLGPKRKHYLLHRDLLSSCSDFFKQTFEKEPNVPLYLTEYDPIAFELFVDWLYRGSLKKISVDLATSAGVSNRSYLLDLYYVAEAWGLFELKNLVTDRMRTWKWGSDCFGPAMLHKLYNSTTDKSPLRRFMVDHFLFASAVWNGEKRIRSVEEHLKYGNNRFVMDCFEATYAAYAKTKYRDPEKRPACAYHIHKDGRSCDG